MFKRFQSLVGFCFLRVQRLVVFLCFGFSFCSVSASVLQFWVLKGLGAWGEATLKASTISTGYCKGCYQTSYCSKRSIAALLSGKKKVLGYTTLQVYEGPLRMVLVIMQASML